MLNTRKLSDVKLINASGKSPMLSNGSQTVFIPPKISQGKPILLIEKSQFGLALTQEAIEVLSLLFKGWRKTLISLGNIEI